MSSIFIVFLLLVTIFAIGRSSFIRNHVPPLWLETSSGFQRRMYYGFVGALKAVILFFCLCWLIFLSPDVMNILWYLSVIPAVGFILGFFLGEKSSWPSTGQIIDNGEQSDQ